MLAGPQDTMLCQPCRSSLDCQVSNAMIDPLNQILSLPRPNLMCLDNICSPSYLEGPIDICNQMETGREELLISVSRKMLAVCFHPITVSRFCLVSSQSCFDASCESGWKEGKIQNCLKKRPFDRAKALRIYIFPSTISFHSSIINFQCLSKRTFAIICDA